MSDLKSRGFANVGGLEDNRNIKALQNTGNKVTMGSGDPRQAEGKVGDITVRQIPSVGLRCYIKTHSGWYDMNSLQGANQLQWKNMVLTGSWVAYSATAQVPQYCIDANGFVHFRGVMKDGANAQEPFVILPPGFRPQGAVAVPAYYPSSLVSTGVQITSDGECNFVSVASSAGTGQIYLDGISFHTRQDIVGFGGGSSSSGGGTARGTTI